jgi:cytochrome d ubiquinol oxidase subunit I
VQHLALWSVPFVYLAGQCGWIVAEVGRQPWAIQDLLPVNAAISNIPVGAVMTTFFIFLALFTILLIAEIKIMCKAINGLDTKD